MADARFERIALVCLLLILRLNTGSAQDLSKDYELKDEPAFKPYTDHRLDVAYVLAPRVPFEARYRYVRQVGINSFLNYSFGLGYELYRFAHDLERRCVPDNLVSVEGKVDFSGQLFVLQGYPAVYYMQNLYSDDLQNVVQWYVGVLAPVAQRWTRTRHQTATDWPCSWKDPDWEYKNLVSENGWRNELHARASFDLGLLISAGLEFKVFWRVFACFEIRGGLMHRWIKPSQHFKDGVLVDEFPARSDTRFDQGNAAMIRLGVRL